MGNGLWLRERKAAILLFKILPHLLLSLTPYLPTCLYAALRGLVSFRKHFISKMSHFPPLILSSFLSTNSSILINSNKPSGIGGIMWCSSPYVPVVLCTFTMRLDFTIHMCSCSTWGLDYNCTLKLYTQRTFFDLTQSIKSLLWTSVSCSTLSMASLFIIHFSNQCSAVMMALLPKVFLLNQSISLKYIK